MTEKYISLKEAAKHCAYSQDYLKLRARQGKLKAVKMGRNWFTTKEWLFQYKKHNKTGPLLTQGKQWPLKFIRRRRGLPIFFLMVIIAAGTFLFIQFFQPTLEEIIPAKTIEISRQI